MGRFSNLEFNENEKLPLQEEQFGLTDETQCLKLADEIHRAGRFEKALRMFGKASALNPAGQAGWFGQVRMLIELDQFKEALIWADKALEQFRNNAELLAAKAVAHSRLRNLTDAMAFSDASLGQKGSRMYVWLARGEALLARGEATDESCFARATAFAPGDWFVHLEAGRTCMFYEKHARAMKHLDQAMTLNPHSAFLWFETGRCHAGLGFPQRARSCYERSVELDREYQPPRDALKERNDEGWLGNLWRRIRS